MNTLEYKNKVIEEVGRLWALSRALENELIDVSPMDGESSDHLDAAQSIAYMMTDILDVFRKTVHEG
ncbi:MAG: hypothetical protein IKB65_09435 [Ruminiclostridium sp.]|nr:hypothetical protein [Ruminiclostridium sp.]